MADVDQPAGELRPWLATARALRAVVSVGRRDLADRGHVEPETWDALDALLDELIDQLPTGPPRHG